MCKVRLTRNIEFHDNSDVNAELKFYDRFLTNFMVLTFYQIVYEGNGVSFIISDLLDTV